MHLFSWRYGNAFNETLIVYQQLDDGEIYELTDDRFNLKSYLTILVRGEDSKNLDLNGINESNKSPASMTTGRRKFPPLRRLICPDQVRKTFIFVYMIDFFVFFSILL